MESNYFLNFPAFVYEGYPAVNLLAHATIRKQFKNNTEMFYTYDIKDGERPDTVAYKLYGSPEYVWTLYLFNDIVDPFYDWPLSTSQLNTHVINKYGSYEIAARTIVKFKNNWEHDDRSITQTDYNNLSQTQRKFWQHDEMVDNLYVRKQIDIETTTNYTKTYSHDIVSDIKDQYRIISQGQNYGNVVFISDEQISINSIIGEFNMDFPVRDLVTGEMFNLIEVLDTQYCIGGNQEQFEQQYVYFSPVNAVDHEEEINIKKQTIKLLRPEYLFSVNRALKDALNND